MLNRAALFLTPLLLVACREGEIAEPREMSREAQSIDLGKAEKLEASIAFPAGEFALLGGAAKLVEGDYRFNHDSLKPKVDYRESAGVGRLAIETNKSASFGNLKATWEIRLNDKVPVELELKMGAGKAEVNLGTLDLRRGSIHFGAGEMTLDLRGKPKKGYRLEVHGGVGHGRIYLPGGIGVRANVAGGIGDIDTQGELRKDGHDYYNGMWDKGGERVELWVRGGVGKIELIAAE